MVKPTDRQHNIGFFLYFIVFIIGRLCGLFSLFLLICLPFGGFGSYWFLPVMFIIGYIVLLRGESKKIDQRIEKIAALVNSQYGTKFQLGKSLSFRGATDITLFDLEAKKMLLVKMNGRVWWLIDFKEIDTWKLHWTESTDKSMTGRYLTKAKDAKIEFYFFCAEQTRLSMSLKNIDEGNYWSHRLSALVR
ncbi:hypothetical protein Undi14_01460 [Undibacterium sp. 14-3-2]|uniref:hypothetical protein n=1 Tax=Undibacterium sp. 14-3-2 TaxID=2800129 RepID=UPI0019078226|nr:hypothetical protein [Undibacterium sp. 14-3-2]MBK1888684.1 hypothetical protein [Undibacterium sp. 14-3-2]